MKRKYILSRSESKTCEHLLKHENSPFRPKSVTIGRAQTVLALAVRPQTAPSITLLALLDTCLV